MLHSHSEMQTATVRACVNTKTPSTITLLFPNYEILAASHTHTHSDPFAGNNVIAEDETLALSSPWK